MALEPTGGGIATTAYELVGAVSTFRNGPNNTLLPIEEITARSTLYDVTVIFDITQATFMGEGAQIAAADKIGEVNAIGGHDHVVALRAEQDVANDGNLYNYLVITVGTDDGLITTDIRARMDSLSSPATYTAIDRAWQQLVALGAA